MCALIDCCVQRVHSLMSRLRDAAFLCSLVCHVSLQHVDVFHSSISLLVSHIKKKIQDNFFPFRRPLGMWNCSSYSFSLKQMLPSYRDVSRSCKLCILSVSFSDAGHTSAVLFPSQILELMHLCVAWLLPVRLVLMQCVMERWGRTWWTWRWCWLMAPSYTQLGKADAPGNLTKDFCYYTCLQMFTRIHFQATEYATSPQASLKPVNHAFCQPSGRLQQATTWPTCLWVQRAPSGSSPRLRCACTASQRPWCQLSALSPLSRML